jgi:uncharacterized phage protein gp47/JayE
MSTLPLPTLAAQITPAGISAPAFEDIVGSDVATYQGIYGSDVQLTPDTQDFQLIAARCTAINDTNQLAIAVYNSFLPGFAQGVGLDAAVQINGLEREVATNSTVNLSIAGVVGTIIQNGKASDSNGNIWILPDVVTIPISGEITVTAVAEQPGAISAPPNTVTITYTITSGWQTVTNPSAATPGRAVEMDAALRRRQAQSTALASQSPLDSILAAVANSGGIGRFAIYENDTRITDSNGQPGNSVAVVVEGGDATAIASVIQLKKGPGAGTFGTTSVNLIDQAGVPVTIKFFELTEVPIFAAMTIQPLAGYISTTGDAAVAALAAFINSLAIGEDVFLNWLLGPAGLSGTALGLTFVITSLTIGISSGSLGSGNIAIAFNAAASCSVDDIVLTTL